MTRKGTLVITTLAKHGDDFALVIKREMLERLGIDADTPLRVEVMDGVLAIVPAREGERNDRFEEALQEVNRRFGSALKGMAD